MNEPNRIAIAVALASAFAAGTAEAAGLRGSPASMRHQHAVAEQNDFTFLRTSEQVREFAGVGRLDTVAGNIDYRLSNVSFPYARPDVVGFIERIAREYHDATGEQLVVTSLTRPTALQPRNAHKLSVHPTGMAVDLRIPTTGSARSWLETHLLALEAKGLLDATREHYPPHYHVAVFPEKFRAYAEANPLPPRRKPVEIVAEPYPASRDALRRAQHADATGGSGPLAIAVLAAFALIGEALARRRRAAASGSGSLDTA